MEITTIQQIEEREWSKVVEKVYGRPYSFQQQEGCQEKGTSLRLTVPKECEDFDNDTVPEEVNGDEMGVRFEAWKARDPNQELEGNKEGWTWRLDLWWKRNFYPDMQVVANDLHRLGELPAGTYQIIID